MDSAGVPGSTDQINVSDFDSDSTPMPWARLALPMLCARGHVFDCPCV